MSDHQVAASCRSFPGQPLAPPTWLRFHLPVGPDSISEVVNQQSHGANIGGQTINAGKVKSHCCFAVPGLDQPVPTLPMFHPSFLLRTPERKREAWRDLLSLRARLDELPAAALPPG
jgi:uracil-DNA glycosylase